LSNLPEKIGQVLLLTDFELRKLFRQKQGYAGLAVIVLLVALCSAGVYMRIHHPHHGPEKFQGQMIRDLVNGISFSLTVLLPGIYILLPMVIGIFAAGSFAGELQNGQIRTVSLRSVPRLSIVLAKFISLSVYSYALLGLMLVVSYAAGAFIFGSSGDILIFGPAFMGKGSEIFIMSGDVAVQRLLLAYFFAGYALVSITAMFIMFSAIFKKMTMAVVVPLGIYFTSYVLGVLPFMENIQRFLPTRYMMVWKYAMAQDVMWDSMMGDGIFLALYTVCYLVIAAVIMNSSDL
jgi:ABC-type transport system involved in multi-copper enzyme maturation permease subunit